MIECKKLTKVFKDLVAVNCVSLRYKKGEFIVLKGSSGSGRCF